MDDTLSSPTQMSILMKTISQRYQSFLDAWTPYMLQRWISTALLIALYLFRILYYQGWYITTYALGIFYVNQFVLFLTPKIDPVLHQEDDDGLSLPMNANEEFRPFIRRLPEFKFWLSSTKAALIAIFCTFFKFLDIPVFWPILVLYFFTLFGITMKRQIKHMIKHKYVPWTHGKKIYKGKSDSSKVYLK